MPFMAKNIEQDNSVSNIDVLFKQLETLSLFELSRLQSAISKTLDDPARNAAIKHHLKIGMRITYFAYDKNDLVEATVVDIRNTRASVVNVHDGMKSSTLNGIDPLLLKKVIHVV